MLSYKSKLRMRICARACKLRHSIAMNVMREPLGYAPWYLLPIDKFIARLYKQIGS